MSDTSSVNPHIVDIINHSFAGKPADVEKSFKAAIQDKMADAIDARRSAIAASMSDEIETDTDQENEDEEV